MSRSWISIRSRLSRELLLLLRKLKRSDMARKADAIVPPRLLLPPPSHPTGMTYMKWQSSTRRRKISRDGTLMQVIFNSGCDRGLTPRSSSKVRCSTTTISLGVISSDLDLSTSGRLSRVCLPCYIRISLIVRMVRCRDQEAWCSRMLFPNVRLVVQAGEGEGAFGGFLS